MFDVAPTVRRQAIVGTLPPPPGVTPNFVNPEYIGHQVVVVNGIFLFLATVVVVLRMYSRLYLISSAGIEDYSVFVGWILSVAFTIICLFSCKYGLGVHLWNIPLTTFSPYYLRINLASTIIYCLSILFIKLSILLLYLRISPDKKFRAAVYLVIVVVVGYNLGSAFVNLFSCTPIAKSWDLSITSGSCINRPIFYFANAGLNIGTDFVMLLLPIPMLWNLHMPMRQKAGLIGVFMAGSFVCIVSIIRLKYLFPLLKNPDITWAVVPALVWCTIEIDVGIICACLPTLKPVLRRHFPILLGSSGRVSSRTPQSGRRHTLGYRPDFELSNVSSNRDVFRKKTGRTTECSAGLKNESQEDIVGAKSHDIVKTTELSVDYSDAGRSGSRGSAEP
ncbi:hypothetical protein BKA61DRAFT_558837 [Leptodontidium sp. MPI-SDFR-AT-0119]|nr:hypothetical protein BKA61DRAFT_558837 [Leptodontidium sp. MPI-SDFR-AT-0119]